jgi:putative ABC transport system permease protein
VTPTYFQTIGVPLLAGRGLTDTDRQSHPPVTLVNETLAKRYFRGADPVGKRIKFGRPQDKDEWVTVVGVVGDVQQDAMDAPPQPEAYVPMAQDAQNDVTFTVRARLDAHAVVGAVRPEIRAVDKDLALTDVTTLNALVHDATMQERFRTSVLTAFAGVAVFLAALGIYGVVAYFVTQRSRELGIRLALGAAPGKVFSLVVRQGLAPVAIGSIVGLAGAYAATGLMRSLLFGITALDVPTYASTTALLAAVAILASAAPAARAARIDPVVALREE